MNSLLLEQAGIQGSLPARENHMKRLLGALAFAALAACTSGPTRYVPALDADDMGYREQRLEQERYRVSFRANPDLRGAQVEDMALRRAAELTIQNGYQWFHVVSRNTDLAGGSYTPSGPTVGIGGSTGSYGSGLGIGLGFNFGSDSRQYEAVIEILMGRGAKPADPNAYDAQQVLSRTM
jgi:hypothetical protein